MAGRYRTRRMITGGFVCRLSCWSSPLLIDLLFFSLLVFSFLVHVFPLCFFFLLSYPHHAAFRLLTFAIVTSIASSSCCFSFCDILYVHFCCLCLPYSINQFASLEALRTTTLHKLGLCKKGREEGRRSERQKNEEEEEWSECSSGYGGSKIDMDVFLLSFLFPPLLLCRCDFFFFFSSSSSFSSFSNSLLLLFNFILSSPCSYCCAGVTRGSAKFLVIPKQADYSVSGRRKRNEEGRRKKEVRNDEANQQTQTKLVMISNWKATEESIKEGKIGVVFRVRFTCTSLMWSLWIFCCFFFSLSFNTLSFNTFSLFAHAVYCFCLLLHAHHARCHQLSAFQAQIASLPTLSSPPPSSRPASASLASSSSSSVVGGLPSPSAAAVGHARSLSFSRSSSGTSPRSSSSSSSSSSSMEMDESAFRAGEHLASEYRWAGKLGNNDDNDDNDNNNEIESENDSDSHDQKEGERWMNQHSSSGSNCFRVQVRRRRK